MPCLTMTAKTVVYCKDNDISNKLEEINNETATKGIINEPTSPTQCISCARSNMLIKQNEQRIMQRIKKKTIWKYRLYTGC